MNPLTDAEIIEIIERYGFFVKKYKGSAFIYYAVSDLKYDRDMHYMDNMSRNISPLVAGKDTNSALRNLLTWVLSEMY